jgi:hypothetical protein
MLVSQHVASGDFMVEQVPLEQVFLRVSVIIFFLLIIVPPMLHTHYHCTLRHAKALGGQHNGASLVLNPF